MVLIGQTHVDIAVQTHAVPAQVVIRLDGRLDGGLVGQIGSHRFGEISARHCLRRGLLLLKFLLTLFEIRETLGQCLVLFAKLFGLSLDVRELIGVSRRREGEDRHRDKSPFHVTPPNKARHKAFANLPLSRPRMRTP